MKLKHAVYLILFSMSITAHAGPRYNDDMIVEMPADGSQPNRPSTNPKKADADKWLAEFRAARDKTFDSGFLRNDDKRRSHTQVVMDLRDRAEKLFGDMGSKYGSCTQAALNVNGYWGLMTNQMHDPSHNPGQIGTIVSMAWNGGDYYSSCRDLIDAIK